MKASEVARMSDDALRHQLRQLVAHDRTTTVRLLIHLGEFDSRRLYRAEGYSSMHAYCLGELKMSDDVANKRIRVARKARRYPAILIGIADGTLTLTGVAMLSRYLSDDTAQELLDRSATKTIDEIAQLIAERFPQPDLPTLILPIVSRAGIFSSPPPTEVLGANCQEVAARPVENWPVAPARVMPLAPDRYGVQFTIGREDRELLQHAKELLSHVIPSGNEGQVFVHALRALVRQLEKRKFGATDRPRGPNRDSHEPHYIAAHVKRAVAQRDENRCTFVGRNGRRCNAQAFLEFDHIEPVASGGRSTIDNLRLRCRAHNRYAAEQAYGAGFVQSKIDESRRASATKRAEEIVPWLRALGIRADHARQAAERCDAAGTLEERVKAALKQFGPREVVLRSAAPA
jgi:HNH endonuclease